MYTREQKIALENNRSMSVSANAGSGKTKVLVEKYLKLLMNGESNDIIIPREVIAITFTRKAASEMMSRVVKLVDEMMSETDNKSMNYKKLRRIKDHLISAKITTIHSFASSILRDYPIEANVLPNFAEISYAESHQITQNCYNLVFNKKLENPDLEKRNELLIIMLKYQSFFEDLIKLICSQTEKYLFLDEFYALSDIEILNLVNYDFKQRFFKLVKSFINSISKCYEHFNGVSIKNFENQKAVALDRIILVKKMLKSDKYYHEDYMPILTEIRNLKFGNALIINKFLDLSLDELNIDDFPSVIFDEIKKLLDCDISEDSHIGFINESRLIYNISGEIIEQIDNIKTERGLVDFDDMLIKVWKLLADKETADSISAEYKVILVDEFQDTNQIQYDIIKALVPLLTDHRANSNTKLNIVGDRKQSIYRFRSADVTVFEKAQDDITYLNSKLLEKGRMDDINENSTSDLTEAELQGVVSLNATFRMKPVVASFINGICKKIMVNESDYDVNYDELVVGRDADLILAENHGELIRAENYLGSVTFLMCQSENAKLKSKESNVIAENESDSYDSDGFEDSSSVNETIVQKMEESYLSNKDQLNQAELLAKFILNSISEVSPLIIEDGTEKRIADFKDFTILSRSRNGFKELAESLTNYNIPFNIHSGNGFYNAQEIIDIISYLKFLNNQKDDLALASVLKSSFFGLNDSHLLNIMTKFKDGNLWEKLTQLVIQPVDIHGFNPIQNAVNILNQALELVNKLSISQLVTRLLEFSAWKGVIQFYKSNLQMKANLQKFTNFAYDFEQKGFKNLYDFLFEIELMQANTQESEAAFISGENVVNIMTIHASKGLEFPIVVFYNSNARTGGGEGPFLSKKYGIIFNYEQDVNAVENNNKELYLYQMAKREEKIAEEAENKRILYVALTRAKEHLVISGVFSENLNKATNEYERYINKLGYFRYFQKNMDINFRQKSTLAIQSIEQISDIDFLTNLGIVKRKIGYPIRIINYIDEYQKSTYSYNFEYHEREILHREIETKRTSDLFSPTKISAYLDDEFKYFLQYELGFINDDDFVTITNQSDDEIEPLNEEIKGSEKGIYVHKILESITKWMNKDGTIDFQKLDIEIKNMGYVNFRQMKDLLGLLINICQKVVSTDLIKQYFPRFEKVIVEQTYLMPLQNNFLNGTIDFLIPNDCGDYEIWDWKSNSINTIENKQYLVNHYEFQMKFYAYMLSKLYKEQEIFVARLLFTNILENELDGIDWTHKFSWNRSELEAFEAELLINIDKIVEFS